MLSFLFLNFHYRLYLNSGDLNQFCGKHYIKHIDGADSLFDKFRIHLGTWRYVDLFSRASPGPGPGSQPPKNGLWWNFGLGNTPFRLARGCLRLHCTLHIPGTYWSVYVFSSASYKSYVLLLGLEARFIIPYRQPDSLPCICYSFFMKRGFVCKSHWPRSALSAHLIPECSS